MELERIKELMGGYGRVIIDVKRYKKHDRVNYWIRPPSPEDPKGLRCELGLKCRIEELPQSTVMIHLVGITCPFNKRDCVNMNCEVDYHTNECCWAWNDFCEEESFYSTVESQQLRSSPDPGKPADELEIAKSGNTRGMKE